MSPSSPPVSRASAPLDEAAEARAHDDYMRGLDPVVAAAADWHTRAEDGLGPDEAAAFRQWLAADPAHARAYARLEQSLETLQGLPDAHRPSRRATLGPSGVVPGLATPAATQAPAPSAPAAAGPRRPAPRRPWWMPRPVAVAACAVLCLAGGLAWQQWQQPTYRHAYATTPSQRLELRLPDGSVLNLDARSRAELLLYRDRREVRLDQGRAMFAVAPDAGRPFEVAAGEVRVTVVGTRFEVRREAEGPRAGGVEIAVEEGRVSVRSAGTDARPAAPRPEAVLTAGQALRVDATGAHGAVTSIAANSVALWRKGLIRFSNTPLAQAIEELERYGPTGLVVSDPAVARLAIGGAYETARPADLAKVLPAILPVRLVPRGDGRLEVVGTR